VINNPLGLIDPLGLFYGPLFPKYTAAIPKKGWITIGDRKYLATAPEFILGRPLWVKRFHGMEEVVGSIPTRSTNSPQFSSG